MIDKEYRRMAATISVYQKHLITLYVLAKVTKFDGRKIWLQFVGLHETRDMLNG